MISQYRNVALVAATTTLLNFGAAQANDLTVSGYLEFLADYGKNYDSHYSDTESQVTELDFSVEGRLNLDYMASTKAGLEYGMHMELDVYQSDGEAETDHIFESILDRTFYAFDDVKSGDGVSFNDGYVFINSALGNIKLGDTGVAGLAKNQLNVPILPLGALAYDDFLLFRLENRILALPFHSEKETLLYSNSFAGIDFEASIDDDGFWAIGTGYNATMGAVDVELGMSAAANTVLGFDLAYLAGSVEASVGGLTAGFNVASMDVDKLATNEYVAAGINYQMGALNVGIGAETQIFNVAPIPNPFGEVFVSNVFAGAEYELADGLTLGVGIGSLDGDNFFNGDYRGLSVVRPRTYNATASVRVEF